MTAAKDKLTSAQSRNSDIENKKPDAKQNCADIVNIALFFDGTGNNDEADKKEKKWSNPSRMYKSATKLQSARNNNFAFYVSGVGTKYNGEPTKWSAREDAATGMGFGGGGSRRIDFGHGNLNQALRQALLDKAVEINAITAEYARKSTAAKISDIQKTLAGYNLVTVINLSVFGFSRGAALARAFVNDFLRKQCTTGVDGKPYYNGYLVHFKFLGLFDTVASFGLPGVNLDTPFSEKNLVVPDLVERCVHYVAAHEIRFSFPVDIIRKHGKYQSNWTETAYPGVHSDVGGGYAPSVQGVSSNYARIPLRDMLHEAWKSSVRLLNYDELKALKLLEFGQLYEVTEETDANFAKYMAAVKPPATIEGAVTAHMKALYSGFGTMTRAHTVTPDLVESDGDKIAYCTGHLGIAAEAEILLKPYKAVGAIAGKLVKEFGFPLHQVAGMVFAQVVRPEMWRLQAWQTTCSKDVVTFVGSSIHDSKAGFLHSIEPFSYFRPRGMAESRRNVLARGMDWLDETETAAKLGTYRILHATGVVIVETWEDGVLVAKNKYKVGEKFVLEKSRAGWTYSVEVVQEGIDVTIWAMNAAKQWVVTSAVAAGKKASKYADDRQKDLAEFANTTKKNAGEYASARKEDLGIFADTTTKNVGDYAAARKEDLGIFADGVQSKAGVVGSHIQSGASSLAHGAGQAVDAGVSAVENTWTSAKSAFGF